MVQGVEIAHAYVALSVKMKNVQQDIATGIAKADVDGAGEKLGERTGKGFNTRFAAVAGAVGGIMSQIADRALNVIGDLVSEASSAADGVDKFKNTLGFAGLDTKNIDKLAAATRSYADRTVYDLTTIQSTTAQLAANSVPNYDKLTEAAGNLNAVAGGNAETFKSVSMVLTQTAGQGKLTTENWNQLSDAIPGASGRLQEALITAGAYTGSFREAMEKGEISADEFNAALMQLGSEPVAVEAAQSTKTLEGSFGNLKATIVGAMSDAINNVKPQLTGLITGVADAFRGAVSVVGEIGKYIQDNVGWLGPLAAGIAAVAAAQAVWTGAIAVWSGVTKIAEAIQLAFSASMLANPIGAIVAAIAALVAGLIYFFTQTELGKAIWEEFTRFLGEAWANISQFFIDAWENVIQPTFKAIGEIAVWLYENVLKPVFDGIAGVVEWVGGVIKFAFDLIVNYFRLWGAIATWLWENAIGPAFEAIGAVINWLWVNVVQPVFTKIGEIFGWIWATIIEPVIGWISEKLSMLGLGFQILYEQYVKPAFENLAKVLSSTWKWIEQNVFAPFGVGIGLIGQAFDNVAKGIGIAWDGIKKAAAVPINFVLDTVWNNGLRSFWNDLVGNLGLSDMKLPKAELVKFATGGVLPGYTPGRDVHEFFSPTGGRLALSGGEAIMRPEFTRAVGGPAGVAQLNAMARNGSSFAFKNGGVWGDVANFAGDVWDNIASAAAVAGDFLADPGGAIQKHVIDGIIRPLLGDGNMITKAIGQMPINLVKNLAGSFATASKGTAGMGWQAMWNLVKANIPGAVMTSGYRSPGANAAVGGAKGSYHMQGRAIDLVPASMAMFNAVRALFPNASELIFSPAGGQQLRNGKPFNGWSDAVRRQHFNHVHLAMQTGGVIPQLYDTGGWLPHGGIAVNRSGRPEAVLNPDESAALRSGLMFDGMTITGTLEIGGDGLGRIIDGRIHHAMPTSASVTSRFGL